MKLPMQMMQIHSKGVKYSRVFSVLYSQDNFRTARTTYLTLHQQLIYKFRKFSNGQESIILT